MGWNRDKWLEDYDGRLPSRRRLSESERPTPEKERAALAAIQKAADGTDRPIAIHEVRCASTAHLAHALWLADFLESNDTGVRVLTRNLFSVEDADKLAAPFEDYEAAD